ncbi:MAG: STAS domain-containing protein [Prosthecobacter sp.]|jgi:anti-anti-sigma regulatory factor|uniref:STAS domain-containing protein n=1 Tax=Prosthecobacter sp. TaxID=1965333 RepID=UPI0019FEACF8|nr:STAS domain-containing protein [Prosthecobacter sp.]MBE2284301.1 STAS domain-containing protein [Prosthecobacter sp.]
MTPPTHILVGIIGRVFWMRVDGRGTFQNSLQAKKALQKVISQGMTQLVVDLERCPMMDSTFLGMLTGTALTLREASAGGSLSVLNANQRNLQLLTSLGLDHILELDRDGKMWASERREACHALQNCGESSAECRETQTQHVLSAHQALAGLSPANECRFHDVIEFLEKELEAGTAAVPG